MRARADRAPAGAVGYKGQYFGSELAARWAAFFDLVGWAWRYKPDTYYGWVPDFWVMFPCCHSECYGSHALLVEVQPYENLEEFKGHPGENFAYGGEPPWDIPADASAVFGANPHITCWEMGHGAGGGEEWVGNWVLFDIEDDLDDLWETAGAHVRHWACARRPR